MGNRILNFMFHIFFYFVHCFHINHTSANEHDLFSSSIVPIKPYALSSVYLLKLAENEEIIYSYIEGYVKVLKMRLKLAKT